MVFYGGHQSKLGYYFRHIYRTIKYIDECPYLDFQQKKSYAKMYRAQLINRLYFSLIQCQIWENLGEKKNKKCLIEKYELIKSIPSSFFRRNRCQRLLF
ncbi:putative phage abortive infection protein [Coprobacter sp.]|uniref:putative phage abortive infection protein n=1 Tax=Coprobacter sp. TaxID=1941478 RepID=UPI003AB22D1E